jgi:hypothetical protein
MPIYAGNSTVNTTITGSSIRVPSAASDPSGANGQLYYNTTFNSLRLHAASGWTYATPDLSTGTQFNTTSLTHSVVNRPTGGLQNNGSTLISTYGTAAPSAINTNYTSTYFGSHGGHGGSGDFPMYWGVHFGGTTRAINRLVVAVHQNSWGYFEVYGSNDSGSASNFATNGTWTRLTLTSSTNGYNNENMRGNSSGLGDGTQFTYNYNNNTGYLAYRIKILDSSAATAAQGTTYAGSAGYWWRFDRA